MSRGVVVVTLLAAAAALGVRWTRQPAKADPHPSPYVEQAHHVVGPDTYDNSCSECHKLESKAWQLTAHQASFRTMHTSVKAKAIANRMGVRSIKRSESCARCHYTSKFDDRLKPMWGVSCESCHGAARDFVEVHHHVAGDLSLKSMRPGRATLSETPQQRRTRLALAAEHGMLHTGKVYDLARSCIECHVVPDPTLVDVGGHPIDDRFEILSWMNGSVRHNFVSSEDGRTNQPMTQARRRLFYLVGTMVDLEMTLGCLATSRSTGPYRDAMIRRANRLIDRATTILRAAPIAEFKAVLGDLPRPLTADAYVEARLSEQLGRITRQYASSHDGTDLPEMDPLLPDASKTIGKPYERNPKDP